MNDQIMSELALSVLQENCGHIPIPLKPASQSVVLWAGSTGHGPDRIASLGKITAASEFESDPHVALTTGVTAGSFIGMADRYGGAGIGRNGGSGRNALVDGFLVKGVGRTPLVCASTHISHASGGAYLEECVRETIYAEVVGHDFPYGAVPVLGILDTGLVQEWPAGIEPAVEPRTLLIRPPFTRPAHFERALGFDSGLPFEGERDHQRVKSVFAAAVSILGKEGLLDLIDQFWSRWVHQLAYGFVHRLSHGNNTSSNISLDGRLVDFGAASTLPSWQNWASSYEFDPFVGRMSCIVRTMRSIYYYTGRHVDNRYLDRALADTHARRCQEVFRRFVIIEVLRLCGVDDFVAAQCARGAAFDRAWHACFEAIDHAQQTKCDLLEPGTYSDSAWDIRKIWSRHPPKHLQRLSRLVSGLIALPDRDAAQAHSHRFGASRPDLYKPNLRARFFAEVQEKAIPNLGADPAFVQDFIHRHVSANLRELMPRSGTESVKAAWAAATAP